VPLFFEALGSLPPQATCDVSSLRLCVSVGAPLPAFVFDKFFRRFGIALQQGYGASHIFPAFAFDTRGVAGAVGQASGPFPMAIVDDESREIPPGHIGEIVVDLRKIKDRFWKGALAENPRRSGNYIFTGDLGRIDGAGNLFVVGRKSEFIKVGGNRVEPAEVESVLCAHPRVREAVVFPVRSGQSREAVAAAVVRRGRLTAKQLSSYCAERLDAYKCPRKIEFHKALPRNAYGKVARHLFGVQSSFAAEEING